MTSPFSLYIDRLKDGHKQIIQEEASPDFLDIHEKELSFPHPVIVSGETYLADEHIILHLNIKTIAKIPCLVCNELVSIPIIIDNFTHTREMEDFKSGIFDYSEELREAILLQVPPFAECRAGNCPERETLKQYLKTGSKLKDSPEKNATHFPFADLDRK
jgi:hypothetical protein